MLRKLSYDGTPHLSVTDDDVVTVAQITTRDIDRGDGIRTTS